MKVALLCVLAVSAAGFDGAAPAGPEREVPGFRVRVFDGARRPLEGRKLLLRVIDGNRRERVSRFVTGPEIVMHGLRFHDNLGDDYSVIVSAPGCGQAGVFPVRREREAMKPVDLMLLPDRGELRFEDASWDRLASSRRSRSCAPSSSTIPSRATASTPTPMPACWSSCGPR